MQKKAAGRFRTLVILTLAAVYFLILLGGLSRAAGAGMGCPDWPRCFGLSKLPTTEAELPADYKSRYADRGYDSLEFNAAKTWLEYLNRWLGAGIGLLVVLLVLLAAPYLRTEAPVFYLSLTVMGLVGLQGFIGVKAVEPELLPLVVSSHLVITLAIVAGLLAALFRVRKREIRPAGIKADGGLKMLMWAALLATGIQIVWGVQVREEIDVLAFRLGYENRGIWVAGLGNWFLLHRLTALGLLLLNGYLFFRLRAVPAAKAKQLGNGIGLVLFLTVLAGYALAWFGFPAFLQPVHLLLPVVLFGLQVQLLLVYNAITKGQLAIA